MSELQKNYFAALGLSRGAGSEEIKRAFKKLAFQYHPDRNPHNEWAEEKFKETVEAYSYLSGNLEAYRALQQPRKTPAQPGGPVEDIFKILFDIDWTPVATRQRTLEVELPLSLEQAFKGVEQKITFTRNELCADCQGTGVEEGAKTFTCTYCFGEGEVTRPGEEEAPLECPKCNGRGFLSSQGCLACQATGVVEQKAKVKVAVPPLVGSGQTLTLPHEGHEFAPGQRGEVLVKISLKKHPSFTFDGKDIICETTVEMGDAALGGEISVPTLNGPKKVHIPSGTQSGQVIRLKGLGLGGDQFVRVWVRTPTLVSEKERSVFRSMKRGEQGSSPSFWSRLKKWIW